MSAILKVIEQIDGLRAKATPGPWYHVQAFQTVPAERTVHGPVPAQRVDFVSTSPAPVHQRIVIPMEGREASVRSHDMALIVAYDNHWPAIKSALESRSVQDAEVRKMVERLRQPFPLRIVDSVTAGHIQTMLAQRSEAASLLESLSQQGPLVENGLEIIDPPSLSTRPRFTTMRVAWDEALQAADAEAKRADEEADRAESLSQKVAEAEKERDEARQKEARQQVIAQELRRNLNGQTTNLNNMLARAESAEHLLAQAEELERGLREALAELVRLQMLSDEYEALPNGPRKSMLGNTIADAVDVAWDRARALTDRTGNT